MRKLIQFSTLIDIYESLEILPDIEIKMHNSDQQFLELDYISLSPIHAMEDNEVAIQLDGQSISHWDRDKVVEIREIK